MSCTPIQDFSLITLNDAGKAGTPGKLYSIVPDTGDGDFSVTRAGNVATRVNAQGIIETVPAGMPRIDFDPVTGEYLGTLVEPQRVNNIRNSVGLGGTIGTDNLPTNWGTVGSNSISREFLGTGIENGISYVDIRFFGVATGTTQIITPESFFLVTTTAGQERVFSYWIKKIGAYNETFQHRIDWRNGTPSTAVQNITLTDNFTFHIFSGTASTGTTFSMGYWGVGLTVGESYDFIIRFGAPQFELSLTATSYIPTTTSAVTRDADVITRTGASALIGQTSGVIKLNARLRTSALAQTVVEIYEDTNNYINIRKNASNEIVATLVVGGTTVGTVTSAVQTAGKKEIEFSYQTGTCTLSVNGVDTTATATGVPACSNIQLGARQNNTEFWNSHVKLTALKTSL